MSSFEFRPGESLSHAVRRIARHEIDEMLTHLRAGPHRREAVHEARKSSKKLRALIRLVRDAIGEKRYRRENTTFRDAVRPLALLRDAEVLVHALDQLTRHFADQVRPEAFGGLRKKLQARARALRRAPQTRAAMRHAAASVARAGSRLARWEIPGRGWRVIQPGLRRICARARAAARRARDDPETEVLHEWRKRSKDLRYVVELLVPIWPPVMKALAEDLHALTDRLGDDHDLAQLEHLVYAEPGSCGTSEDCAVLLGLIAMRRGELQADARSLGERPFSEKPRAFVTRFGGYWTAWEHEMDGGGVATGLVPAGAPRGTRRMGAPEGAPGRPAVGGGSVIVLRPPKVAARPSGR